MLFVHFPKAFFVQYLHYTDTVGGMWVSTYASNNATLTWNLVPLPPQPPSTPTPPPQNKKYLFKICKKKKKNFTAKESWFSLYVLK